MTRRQVLGCVALLAVAVAGSGCDGARRLDHSSMASVRRPIVGGTVDSGHPAVGAVLMADGLCSGTLISPSIVLTAAHCLEGGTPERFVTGGSMYGTGVRVKLAVPHPDYDPGRWEQSLSVGWHDIGVVVLESPADVAPIPYRDAPLEAHGDHAITFVGFGDPNAGYKYRVDTTIGAVWTQGFWNYTNPSNPHNTCNGDSGGPALMMDAGVEQVIGVVSSGDPYCNQDGYNTRTDTNAEFLGTMIARYEGGSPDGTCGDGTCDPLEDQSSCPDDCGQAPSVCGNGTCEAVETVSACPADCAQGTQGMWEPCSSTSSCRQGLVCLGTMAGGGYCTTLCGDPEGGTGCPDGYACAPIQAGAGAGGACVPSGTVCRDALCGFGETVASCPADCHRGCNGIGEPGCCDGNVVTWCEEGETRQYACPDGPCGWNAEAGYYDCTGAADADPAGQHPRTCSAATTCGDGTCAPDETCASCPKDCACAGETDGEDAANDATADLPPVDAGLPDEAAADDAPESDAAADTGAPATPDADVLPPLADGASDTRTTPDRDLPAEAGDGSGEDTVEDLPEPARLRAGGGGCSAAAGSAGPAAPWFLAFGILGWARRRTIGGGCVRRTGGSSPCGR